METKMPDPTPYVLTFDAEHPFSVGWELKFGTYYRHTGGTMEQPTKWEQDQIDIIRDPDNFGPCLVCQRPTDWHLLDQGQRICSAICLERAISHIEEAKVIAALKETGFPPTTESSPQFQKSLRPNTAPTQPPPTLRRYPRPAKPVQRPCGGCGKKGGQK
jgi:hypothetical protein